MLPDDNFTTCIRSNNINTIEQKLTRLLEAEGCCRLNELPQIRDSSQVPHIWESDCSLIINLYSSQSGWTIVKTAPQEFLCQRAKGDNRTRLSALAILLGCDAFYLGMYSSYIGILLEADASGRIFVSGGSDIGTSGERFWEEQINAVGDLKDIAQFSILEVPELLQAAMRANENSELLAKEAEVDRLIEENSDESDRQLSILEFFNDETDEFHQGYAQRIDRALAKVIDDSHDQSQWYCNNLIYDVYSELSPLANDRAKLLYFQLPSTYQPSEPYGLITSPSLNLDSSYYDEIPFL